MPAVLRLLSFALGAVSSAAFARAQADAWPVFAAKPDASPATAAPRAQPGTPLRRAMAEQILATAQAFPLPAAPGPPVARTREGVLLMEQFVVKAMLPRRDEVERPEHRWPRFQTVGRIDRISSREKAPQSATLLEFWNGAGRINVNVVNGAGQGVDHPRDFTRVEIEVSFRW